VTAFKVNWGTEVPTNASRHRLRLGRGSRAGRTQDPSEPDRKRKERAPDRRRNPSNVFHLMVRRRNFEFY
jgi:hypothetical protein